MQNLLKMELPNKGNTKEYYVFDREEHPVQLLAIVTVPRYKYSRKQIKDLVKPIVGCKDLMVLKNSVKTREFI